MKTVYCVDLGESFLMELVAELGIDTAENEHSKVGLPAALPSSPPGQINSYDVVIGDTLRVLAVAMQVNLSADLTGLLSLLKRYD